MRLVTTRKYAEKMTECLARLDYAGAAAAQDEMAQRRSASRHEELLAKKNYAGAAALQARAGNLPMLGSAAGHAQEFHAATGQGSPLSRPRVVPDVHFERNYTALNTNGSRESDEHRADQDGDPHS